MDVNLRALEPISYESSAVVPVGYAEKTMASLMQLHSELMDEKERRVDLYRRLMDKEQVVAELRMYVQMLEDRIAAEGRDSWKESGLPNRPVSSASVPISPSSSDEVRAREPAKDGNSSTYRASAFSSAANLRSSRNTAEGEGWKAW